MAGLPQFLISTQTDPYWEIPFFDTAGHPLSVAGRTFEAWITPATSKTGVGEPVAALKVLTFADGLSLVPPTDGSGDQTIRNTFVHRVSRAFAQANFPRGELTADILEVVDGARRLLVPVRLRYDDPAAIRDFVADRAGVVFGAGRQPITTPVAVAGQTGQRGAGFITEARPPTAADGADGDYWIDSSADPRMLYGPKADGAWPAQGEPFTADLTPALAQARDEAVAAVGASEERAARAKAEADRSAASAVSAAQVAPNRTYEALLSELAGNPALPVGTVRQVLTDPNAGTYDLRLVSGTKVWVRAGDTVPAIAGGLARRALASQVPGRGILDPDVAYELVDRSGTRRAALMRWGEWRAPGRPIFGGSEFATLNGSILWEVAPNGQSYRFGPLRHGTSLDAAGRVWTETDEAGTVLRRVRDRSFVNGALETRMTLDRTGGVWAESGAPLAARTVHGVGVEAVAYDAWVNGGQAFAWVNGSTIQLTAGTQYSFLRAEVRDGQIALIRSDNVRHATPLCGAYPPLVPGTTTVVAVEGYGQSVMAGNAAGVTPLHPASFSPRALMFAGGQRTFGNRLGHPQERTYPLQAHYDAIHDFVPAREQYVLGAGETPMSQFASTVLANLPASATVLTTVSAVGSANAQMLARAATEAPSDVNTLGEPWANLEQKFVRACLFWRMQGLRFVAGPMLWNQGEGNASETKAAYQARLLQIAADWQALAERWNAAWPGGDLGGVAGRSPFVAVQMCSGAKYGLPRSGVPWAQLQINLDDPTRYLCAGPVYDQDYAADGVHLLASGQVMQGARMAVAVGAWLRGETWRPLHIRKDTGFAPARTGATIRCRIYNHFGLPLTFDTARVTGLGAAQGLTWRDNGDGNSVTVTGATIVDATTLDVTLSAAPTGTGGLIEVGVNGAGGAGSGPATGNRCALRTNGSPVRTDDGRAVEHWLSLDSVPVA